MPINEALLHHACIAIGANLGARELNIQKALALLEKHPEITLGAVSRFMETNAVGGSPGQPKYLNGAALLRTSLSPRSLLDTLLFIECKLGRDRLMTERNAPRTMDLDLLLYGDTVRHDDKVSRPFPDVGDRMK